MTTYLNYPPNNAAIQNMLRQGATVNEVLWAMPRVSARRALDVYGGLAGCGYTGASRFALGGSTQYDAGAVDMAPASAARKLLAQQESFERKDILSAVHPRPTLDSVYSKVLHAPPVTPQSSTAARQALLTLRVAPPMSSAETVKLQSARVAQIQRISRQVQALKKTGQWKAVAKQLSAEHRAILEFVAQPQNEASSLKFSSETLGGLEAFLTKMAPQTLGTYADVKWLSVGPTRTNLPALSGYHW